MASSPLAYPAADQPPFRERTLARLVDHVRALIEVDAVAVVTVGGRGRGAAAARSAAWPADPALRESFDALVEVVLERDLPLLHALAPASDAVASAIACPLHTETGQVLGVLVVASLDAARPLARSDLGAVTAAADLTAMALERAILLEEEARRRREELCLKRAAEGVSASLELDEVYRCIAQHAAELTGATHALLTRLNARAGELTTAASLDLTDRPLAHLSLESDAFRRVALTRRPLVDRGGAGSLLHAPIELGPRLYGVLTVAHEQAGQFGEEECDLLARLARSSAAAIANAIEFGRERRIARALTLGFVPESLPVLAGCETGLLYVPALGEPTGGDVYGAWPLPDGDVAVLVGDVAGKGVENAALSAMVRFFVEARSWDTRSPAAVLEQANSMLIGRLPPDTFVTAFYGVLSPDSLRWSGAGHLPPLHLSGSCVRELEPHGLPLGVDAAPGYGERELELAPGDLVFAFTDGLVEARRGETMFGVRRLARLVASWRRRSARRTS